MTTCDKHPGRRAVATVGNGSYCQNCRTSQIAAASRLATSHVTPKDCFVTHKTGDLWVAIDGTGCAHWVSHQLNAVHFLRVLRRGGPATTTNRCLEGHPIRVQDLIFAREPVPNLRDVRINDIWAKDRPHEHCGLVVGVRTDSRGVVQISIKHDSSAQGQVATNDFRTYFNGEGAFYR